MAQQSLKKLALEHLVVSKMGRTADLNQDELDDILRYGAAELFAEEHADKSGGELAFITMSTYACLHACPAREVFLNPF